MMQNDDALVHITPGQRRGDQQELGEIPSELASRNTKGAESAPQRRGLGVLHLFSAPSTQRKAKRRLPPFTLLSLLLVLTSFALLPSVLFPTTASTLTIPTPNIGVTSGDVGVLSFTSSGQLDPHANKGLNDIVTLNLQGIQAPKRGMTVYVWLMADKTQDGVAPLLLGTLPIASGKAMLTYQDRQHTDLLVSYSRLLVTEQTTGLVPNTPPLDTKSWLYQGGIPDVPTPGDEKGYSLLSHMRHLLAQDPTLTQLGLQGGLDIWLYRNIGKIFEWSNAARDDWAGSDVNIIRRQVDRVVEYLDGQVYAFRDLPPGTPWLVDSHAGRPGILDYTTAQDEQGPPSWISHVKLHLAGMVNAPDHSEAQQHLASLIDADLTKIEILMKAVKKDAVQLARMSDVQLKGSIALSLLNDMEVRANNAYVGTDPTGIAKSGEVWVHSQLQSLATVPVMVATADGP